MKQRILFCLLIIVIILPTAQHPLGLETIQAQTDNQLLTAFVAVEGSLNDDVYVEEWTLNGFRGEPISLVARAIGGDLNPIIRLLDSSGNVLAENDDSRLNDLSARIENFVLPADDIYTVHVGRVGLEQGLTSGNYELLWLEGSGSELNLVTNLEKRIWLSRSTLEDVVVLPQIDTANVYLQTTVQFTSAADNLYQVLWKFGMWQFNWSPDGHWQLDVIDATGNTLDSIQGASDILANPEFAGVLRFTFLDNDFELMINNEVAVTHSTDAEMIHFALEPQVYFSVDSEPNGSPSFAVRETYISEIYYASDNAVLVAVPPLAPEDYLWSYQELPSVIMDEMVADGLVPDGGGVNALARDGYIYNYRIGFSAYPLFIDRVFTDFVVGYTGILLEGTSRTACGLLFNQVDGSNFASVVYTPQRELYLLDYVDGEPSSNSIMLQTPFLAAGLETQNYFIVVAQAGTARVYLNGRLVEEFDLTTREGEMYVQLVLDEQQSANCLLQGLWVWEW